MIERVVLKGQCRCVASLKHDCCGLPRTACSCQPECLWIIVDSVDLSVGMVTLDEHGVGAGSAAKVEHTIGAGHAGWIEDQSTERIVRHRAADQGIIQRTR